MSDQTIRLEDAAELTTESAGGLALHDVDLMIRGRVGAIAVPADAAFFVVDLRDRVNRRFFRLEPRSLRALFRGTHDPGDFVSNDPSGEYNLIFMWIERILSAICQAQGKPIRDEEAVQLFSELRRRPDGRYASALFAHFRAALALWLTVRPTSEAEYNAIMGRLVRSARTFRTGATSTFYYDKVLNALV